MNISCDALSTLEKSLECRGAVDMILVARHGVRGLNYCIRPSPVMQAVSVNISFLAVVI